MLTIKIWWELKKKVKNGNGKSKIKLMKNDETYNPKRHFVWNTWASKRWLSKRGIGNWQVNMQGTRRIEILPANKGKQSRKTNASAVRPLLCLRPPKWALGLNITYHKWGTFALDECVDKFQPLNLWEVQYYRNWLDTWDAFRLLQIARLGQILTCI